MIRKHKYLFFKSAIVYLLLVSWITGAYASEFTNCRCSHFFCSHNSHKKTSLNRVTGFSSQFKVFSKASNSNNCCSHKTNHKNQSKNCNGPCECSVSEAITFAKDVLTSQNRLSVNKDFFHSVFLNLWLAPAKTENQHNLSPPLKLSSNKVFLSFSILRI